MLHRKLDLKDNVDARVHHRSPRLSGTLLKRDRGRMIVSVAARVVRVVVAVACMMGRVMNECVGRYVNSVTSEQTQCVSFLRNELAHHYRGAARAAATIRCELTAWPLPLHLSSSARSAWLLARTRVHRR